MLVQAADIDLDPLQRRHPLRVLLELAQPLLFVG